MKTVSDLFLEHRTEEVTTSTGLDGFAKALAEHDKEIESIIDEMIGYYDKLALKDAKDKDSDGVMVCRIKTAALTELKEKIKEIE